jgi:hypothetical protein
MRKFRYVCIHGRLVDTHRRSAMRKLVKVASGNVITVDAAYPNINRHIWDNHMRADAYLRLLRGYFIAYKYW